MWAKTMLCGCIVLSQTANTLARNHRNWGTAETRKAISFIAVCAKLVTDVTMIFHALGLGNSQRVDAIARGMVR